MQGVPATYLGKIVNKTHFRTFIYAPDGSKKLVESWEEYERHIETGLWFAVRGSGQVLASNGEVEEEKPRRARKSAKEEPKQSDETLQKESD